MGHDKATASVRAADAGAPTVAGSVTGYRWWTLPAPDWGSSPARAEENWPHAPLHGYRGPWQPGGGPWHAGCLHGHPAHDPAVVPAERCRCGFYATWFPVPWPGVGPFTIPVAGVVKGFGQTRLATRGFRCGKARILGLHLSLTLLPYVSWQDYGAQLVTRTMDDGRQVLLPAWVSHAVAQAAVSHADAWLAVVGDRLAGDYPGVRVSETMGDLMTAFPPDPVYARRR